jgi:hypothetical protein
MANETDETDESDSTGAIDNGFEESLRDSKEVLTEAVAGIERGPIPGGVALDLVTRQLLFVRREVAESLSAYHKAEEFDLLSYGVHPYLPVTIEDPVFECVFLSEISAQKLAKFGDEKTYDFPRGRLAHVPVEQAWLGGIDDE